MPAASQNGNGTPITNTTSKEDQADLDAINGAVDRMRTLTAPDPYVLTIPQDIEPRYHHSYQYQAMQWLHQAPFHYREGEATQYQTFVYHEHGKDMYVLHNSRPREEADRATGKSKASTAANTPNAGPKKKMSLGAYKKKQVGGGGTPAQEAPAVKPVDAPAKQPAVKGPVERVRAETDEVLAAVAEESLGKPAEKAKEDRKAEKKELKRKREDDEKHEERSREDTRPDEEPATKRARAASPPPATKDSKWVPSPSREPVKSPQKPSTPLPTSEDTALPPRLSPLEVPSMPTRLSPTLPTNIAATLKAREHQRPSSPDNSAPSSATMNEKLTPMLKPEGITKHKSPIPRNGFRASSSPAIRSGAEEKAKPPTSSAPQRAKSPELSKDEEKAVGKALKVKQSDKPALLVKLKYRKQQRDDIRRILGMRPRPKSSPTPQPAATATRIATPKPTEEDPRIDQPAVRRRDPNARGVAQKVGPAAKRVAAKKTVEKPPSAEKRPATKASDFQDAAVRQKVVSEAAKKDVEKAPPKRKAEPAAETRLPSTDVKGEDAAPSRKPASETVEKSVEESPAKRKVEAAVEKPSATPDAKVEDAAAKPKAAAEPTQKNVGGSSAKRKAEVDALNVESREPLAKRKKIPSSLDTKKDPSTPIQSALQSPAMPLSIQKAQQITPSIHKDHLSVPMQREQSMDSNANTPSAKSDTPKTNGMYTSQPNGIVKPSSSQPSSKTPKQQLWETEQKRLETLGRELKHAASAHLNSLKVTHSDPAGPSNEQKLAAVKSVESLLAYFLAFVSADEAALAADPKQVPAIKNWRSLHGFFGFVRRNCEAFPLLLGLVCQLGVVFNARIIDITMQYPSERPTRDTRDNRDNRDPTLETYSALSKHAADADAQLDIDALRDNFPRTWKQRAKGTPSLDTLTGPADFAGEYKLPLSVATSPLRATRVGYTMLAEWVAKEKVGYEMKLKL